MFLTNFNIEEIERYKRAVDSWDSPHKSKLKVSAKSNAKVSGSQGSLHWFGSFDELHGFWDHFDNFEIKSVPGDQPCQN